MFPAWDLLEFCIIVVLHFRVHHGVFAKTVPSPAVVDAVLAQVDGEAFSLPETLSALVRSEEEDETHMTDDLEDLTDILSPAETKNNE